MANDVPEEWGINELPIPPAKANRVFVVRGQRATLRNNMHGSRDEHLLQAAECLRQNVERQG